MAFSHLVDQIGPDTCCRLTEEVQTMAVDRPEHLVLVGITDKAPDYSPASYRFEWKCIRFICKLGGLSEAQGNFLEEDKVFVSIHKLMSLET